MSAQLWTIAPFMALAMSQVDLPPQDAVDSEQNSDISIPLSEQDASQISFERIIIIRVPRFEVEPESRQNRKAHEPKRVDCIAADSVMGVKPAHSGALDLLTSNGHYRATMPKGCDARQFYSGFYVEKPGDGRLCVNREELHSRSGMTCEIESIYALSR